MSETDPLRQSASPMISGSEWEVCADVALKPNGRLRQPTYAQLSHMMSRYRMPVEAIGESADMFLGNGARFYIDHGDKLEYSGPEEATITEAVQRELDGEVYVTNMFRTATERGYIAKAEVYKRTFSSGRIIQKGRDGKYTINAGDGPTSCGSHLNTGAKRIPGKVDITPETLMPMAWHVSTRPLYLGSGAVVPSHNGQKGLFSLHQRAPFVGEDFDSGTTNIRPVINLRDEPLAHGEDWIRFHDIHYDSAMSPWVMSMARGTNRLILRLGQVGETLRDYRPAADYPFHRVMRHTSFDMTHKRTVRLENGTTITPLQIQQELFAACMKLTKNFDLIDDELWTLAEWERALADFKVDPYRLKDRTDWVAKKRALDNYKINKGIAEQDWDDPRLEAVDRSFSLLTPESHGMKLRRKVWARWLPPGAVDRTDENILRPPQTTRAIIRGEFVRRYGVMPGQKMSKDPTVSWGYLRRDGVSASLAPFSTDASVLNRFAEAQVETNVDEDHAEVTWRD